MPEPQESGAADVGRLEEALGLTATGQAPAEGSDPNLYPLNALGRNPGDETWVPFHASDAGPRDTNGLAITGYGEVIRLDPEQMARWLENNKVVPVTLGALNTGAVSEDPAAPEPEPELNDGGTTSSAPTAGMTDDHTHDDHADHGGTPHDDNEADLAARAQPDPEPEADQPVAGKVWTDEEVAAEALKAREEA